MRGRTRVLMSVVAIITIVMVFMLNIIDVGRIQCMIMSLLMDFMGLIILGITLFITLIIPLFLAIIVRYIA